MSARTFFNPGLALPFGILTIILLMVVPIPAMLLDVFFVLNIALSVSVLMAAMNAQKPLDFSSFPSVLLFATLLRLALNVASTRIVLLNGHEGGAAAGKVIEAFGAFLIGGNFAVGIFVFLILMIINLMVVTKGAGRVSEVSARFTLDALPGKQMAIDADLAAGLLTADEAKARRREIATEADFYGSMDGASKFVRGDAVAGILILFINVIGGLGVGVGQHNLSFSQAMHNYTLLTIGDGLVAQLPSLLLSTAVAIIVTRISRPQNMGEQMVGQMAAKPEVLYLSAAVLGLIGIIPGMPNLVFLMLAAACGVGGWLISRHAKQPQLVDDDETAEADVPAAPESNELKWDEVTQLDVVSLEVGYRLIPLVDRNQGGELIGRITAVRKKLSKDLGFLVQSVHIRDNLELSPGSYRIQLLGDSVAQGEVQAGKELAINPGGAQGGLQGVPTKDPAFGMDAIWIDPSQRDQAQTLGYTVVDPCTVIATHLSQVIKQHAHELLGHEEVQQLLDRLASSDPKLVESLVPAQLPLSVVVKVLQNLLKENISIRSIRLIAESLAEQAPRCKNPDDLLEGVRVSLGRMIVQEINGLEEELPVVALDADLEQMLQDMVRGGNGAIGLEPGIAERIQRELAEFSNRQELAGQPAVVLVSPSIRAWLSRFTRRSVPNLHVLSYNEVPDSKEVRLLSTIGQQGRLT